MSFLMMKVIVFCLFSASGLFATDNTEGGRLRHIASETFAYTKKAANTLCFNIIVPASQHVGNGMISMMRDIFEYMDETENVKKYASFFIGTSTIFACAWFSIVIGKYLLSIRPQ
jgi:hypothetical protein